MKNYFLGGIVGFIIGVLGNLVAAWIQKDMLQDAFSGERIIFILIITVCGLIIAALIEHRTTSQVSTGRTSNAHTNNFSGIRLWWSRLTMRGKGTNLNDVKSFGSDIDIDTR